MVTWSSRRRPELRRLHFYWFFSCTHFQHPGVLSQCFPTGGRKTTRCCLRPPHCSEHLLRLFYSSSDLLPLPHCSSDLTTVARTSTRSTDLHTGPGDSSLLSRPPQTFLLLFTAPYRFSDLLLIFRPSPYFLLLLRTCHCCFDLLIVLQTSAASPISWRLPTAPSAFETPSVDLLLLTPPQLLRKTPVPGGKQLLAMLSGAELQVQRRRCSAPVC